MTLNTRMAEMANDIHNRNVKAGWWTDLATGKSTLQNRNRAELMMLVVSEASEADFGILNNLNDDKLPHLPMFDVELADVAIRLFDMIGAETSVHGELDYDYDEAISSIQQRALFETVDRALLTIINEVSAAMEHLRKGRITQYRNALMVAQSTVFAVALAGIGDRKIDLFDIIDQKLNFNANRPDHKIENRVKEDGKKF